MNARVLITGDRGFIGSFLGPAFAASGWKLQGLDSDPHKPPLADCDSHLGDIRDPAVVEQAIEGASMVVNLAAAHCDFGIEDDEYFDVNVNGTQILLDKCSTHGVKRFVFISSVAVYGASATTVETATPAPTTPYGRSKLEAELRVRTWVAADSERSAIVIRPTVVFGPRNFANMSTMIRHVMNHRFLFVGNGHNVKSIAYVENLVAALYFLVERCQSGLHLFNYTDQPDMTMKEFVSTVASVAGVWLPPIHIPRTPARWIGRILDLVADVSGIDLPITGKRIERFCTTTPFDSNWIRQEGFVQPYTIREGIEKTVRWMKG